MPLTTRERAWNEMKAVAFAVGLTLLFFILTGLLSIARAQDPSDLEQAQASYSAFRSGNLWLAASLAVSFFVHVLRKYGVKLLPDGKVRAFVLSDRGGVTLTIASAFLGGLIHVFTTKMPFGWDWLGTVGQVTLGALGGFAGARKLLFPSDKAAPAPASPTA